MKRFLIFVTAFILIVMVVIGAVSLTNIFSNAAKADEQNVDSMVTDKRPNEWEENLFPKDEVFEVRIYINDSDFTYMNENAMNEETVPATIVYNGIKVENIGIRPKGNSSLMMAVEEGENQFSFRMDFDEYADQDLHGITSIYLNNGNNDSSYIREYLAYDVYEQMGIPVPERAYCNLYINDELYGPYLAVQAVDENMVSAWFHDGDGYLYKPDGLGADFSYIDANYKSYSGFVEKTAVTKQGQNDLVVMIDVLNNGGDIEQVLDVDMVLRYIAVDTCIIHHDSYQGGMFHNYFVYGENGKYMMLPWDLNITFQPFGMAMTSNDVIEDLKQVTEYYIDEPTCGLIEDYPLINSLLSSPEYLATYRGYVEYIVNNLLDEESITQKAQSLHDMLDEYVQNDPTPKHEYDKYKNSLFGDGVEQEKADIADMRSMTTNSIMLELDAPPLIDFITERNENIRLQLSGKLPSSNNGQGNPVNTMAKLVGNMKGGINIDSIGENMPMMPPADMDIETMLGQVFGDMDTQDIEAMFSQMLGEDISIEDIEERIKQGDMPGIPGMPMPNMQGGSMLMMQNIDFGYYTLVVIALIALIVFTTIIKKKNKLKVSK